VHVPVQKSSTNHVCVHYYDISFHNISSLTSDAYVVNKNRSDANHHRCFIEHFQIDLDWSFSLHLASSTYTYCWKEPLVHVFLRARCPRYHPISSIKAQIKQNNKCNKHTFIKYEKSARLRVKGTNPWNCLMCFKWRSKNWPLQHTSLCHVNDYAACVLCSANARINGNIMDYQTHFPHSSCNSYIYLFHSFLT